MSLRLIPCDCPSCGSALRGDSTDILFLCDHCGAGAVLSETGLSMVDSTALLPAPGRVAELWRPAWVVEADVRVERRVRADGGASQGWHEKRTFVVPAFAVALEELTRLARAQTNAAGAVGEVPREPVRGGTLHLEDAVTLIRHLVVGDEVRQPDMLASVEVTVEVVGHRLAATPYARQADGLQCALTGVTISEQSLV